MLALVVPVLLGWSLLAWETRVRANASYDAYKFISVFYPGLLAGLCCWLAAVRQSSRWVQGGAGLILAAIVMANVWVGGGFPTADGNSAFSGPPPSGRADPAGTGSPHCLVEHVD